MKLIVKGKVNRMLGYCYAGWVSQGCQNVCNTKCSQVCHVDMGPTQSPSATKKMSE